MTCCMATTTLHCWVYVLSSAVATPDCWIYLLLTTASWCCNACCQNAWCHCLVCQLIITCHLLFSATTSTDHCWRSFPPKTATVMEPVHHNAVRETQLHSNLPFLTRRDSQTGDSPPEMAAAMQPVHHNAVNKTHFEAKTISIFGNKPSTSPYCSSCCLLNIVDCHCIFATKHHQGFSPQETAVAILPLC